MCEREMRIKGIKIRYDTRSVEREVESGKKEW